VKNFSLYPLMMTREWMHGRFVEMMLKWTKENDRVDCGKLDGKPEMMNPNRSFVGMLPVTKLV
jgi:hypothetical protein